MILCDKVCQRLFSEYFVNTTDYNDKHALPIFFKLDDSCIFFSYFIGDTLSSMTSLARSCFVSYFQVNNQRPAF